MRIRKGDLVEIISGEDKTPEPGRPRLATVLRVLRKEEKVLVEGINTVYKHVRPDRKNPQGGRLEVEAPIHMSNVMPACSKCNRGVRVGYKKGKDGAKVRVCRLCGAELGKVSKAR